LDGETNFEVVRESSRPAGNTARGTRKELG
jgi:hypothetical protein